MNIYGPTQLALLLLPLAYIHVLVSLFSQYTVIYGKKTKKDKKESGV